MNLEVLRDEYGKMEVIRHKSDSRDVLLNKNVDHNIKVLNAAYEQRVSRTDAAVISVFSVIELYSITITMYFFPSLSRSLSPSEALEQSQRRKKSLWGAPGCDRGKYNGLASVIYGSAAALPRAQAYRLNMRQALGGFYFLLLAAAPRKQSKVRSSPWRP